MDIESKMDVHEKQLYDALLEELRLAESACINGLAELSYPQAVELFQHLCKEGGTQNYNSSDNVCVTHASQIQSMWVRALGFTVLKICLADVVFFNFLRFIVLQPRCNVHLINTM